VSHREGALKSPQILLSRIDFLWATKLKRFVAVQLVWVGFRGSESGAPRAWLFFFQKITHFKHISIQIFALKHDLKLLQYVGAHLNKSRESLLSLLKVCLGRSTYLPLLTVKNNKAIKNVFTIKYIT